MTASPPLSLKPAALDAAAFQRDGFLIVRGVFNGDELERLRDLAGAIQLRTHRELPSGTRYWTGPGRSINDVPAAERGAYTWGVNEITRPCFFHPELVNVFAHPGVHATLHALVAEPRAWGIKILWTPKVVGYDLGWHRDQVAADLYDFVHFKPAAQDHVQFNAALNEDHCFLVVPGSHRRPLTAEEWQALRTNKTAPLPGEVVARLAPGDILYMDAHTLHRGRSSIDGNRLTLHYSVQAQWVPLHPWGDPADFDFITSDAFISQLAPAARPLYERLRTAEQSEQAMEFLHQAAAAHGWQRPVTAATAPPGTRAVLD